MQKIQIGQAAIAGFKALFGQFSSALRIGWLPLVSLVVVQTVSVLLIGFAVVNASRQHQVFETKNETERLELMKSLGMDLLVDYGWLAAVAGIITVAAYVMLTSTWLRHLLRGDELGDRVALVRFGKREWKTLWAGFLLMVFVTVLPLAAIGLRLAFNDLAVVVPMFLVVFVFNIVIYFIAMRLALVFPMIALDQGLGWRAAWQMSRGNSWRLFWSLFLASLLVNVLFFVIQLPFGLVAGVAGMASPDGFVIGMVIQLAAYGAVYVVGLMIMLGTLADAYRQLNGPGSMASEAMLSVFDE